MEFLLSSLKRFFETLALTNHWFSAFSVAFPGSLYLFQRAISLTGDKFSKYVVFPNCSSIYTFKDCYRLVGNHNLSKTCTFVCFANRRQRRMRKPCGAILLKEVTLSGGTTRLYPHKLFCFKSLVETLTQFVKRPGLIERCELWSAHRIMCDVFEGRIWKEFQVFNGSSFLASRRNYALMLNVDWMQPFEHTQYSVGVMYLVLMNLPRSERFKRENVLLVGIISGPSEPRININSFLKPLVDELVVLWEEGVMLRHSGSLFVPECFKAALLCVACDMPASRKICGFTALISSMVVQNVTKSLKLVALVLLQIILVSSLVVVEILWKIGGMWRRYWHNPHKSYATPKSHHMVPDTRNFLMLGLLMIFWLSFLVMLNEYMERNVLPQTCTCTLI